MGLDGADLAGTGVVLVAGFGADGFAAGVGSALLAAGTEVPDPIGIGLPANMASIIAASLA